MRHDDLLVGDLVQWTDDDPFIGDNVGVIGIVYSIEPVSGLPKILWTDRVTGKVKTHRFNPLRDATWRLIQR